MSEYKFHAFFSYKRSPRTDEWHARLCENLKYWIGQELDIDPPSVFFDRRSIENGHDFDDIIRDALRSSKVIVSIFSPLYFTSRYCASEFESFLAREEELNMKRGTLIACARFHDGENYPDKARSLQSEDFSDFANLAPEFWKSQTAVIFDPIIKSFAVAIAKKIKAAPPFSAAFPVMVVDESHVPQPKPIGRPSDYLSKKNRSLDDMPKG